MHTPKSRKSHRGTPLADAIAILGLSNVLGPHEVGHVFLGGRPPEGLPIPFSPAELERAKALGQRLYLQVDTMVDAKGKKTLPLTPQNLKARFEKAHDGKPMWYDQRWYDDENFFKEGAPAVGWRLTDGQVLPDKLGKNYLQQTDLLAAHLKGEIWKGVAPPKQYADAIAEYEREKKKIEGLMNSDWQAASQALADLRLNRLCRESPVEAMYRLALENQARGTKPLPDKYTWTSGRDSDGHLVAVGSFDSGGADVDYGGPRARDDYLGVCFSRMK